MGLGGLVLDRLQWLSPHARAVVYDVVLIVAGLLALLSCGCSRSSTSRRSGPLTATSSAARASPRRPWPRCSPGRTPPSRPAATTARTSRPPDRRTARAAPRPLTQGGGALSCVPGAAATRGR